MKRYLEIDPSDEKKARAVPHPLEDIFNFIAGGSDTTAYSTTCAVHYLLTSPSALSKLQAELDDAAPYIRHNFDHRKIQSLPYLVRAKSWANSCEWVEQLTNIAGCRG
jgi:hypothetical protein